MPVHLVGAGPGDPGLITRKGAELLRRAQVVVYDRLTAAALLDLVPADAERIYVGKSPGSPSMPQERINELLVGLGRDGREVVRLKGGDPFVFARGAEEARALEDAGVAWDVVPGVTSALAAPAYAGIPATLRYSSTSVTIVTGHEDPTKGRTEVDWESLAKVGGTILVLMGVGRWPAIAERLLAGGLPADTPAAAVRSGTTPDQHTVVATLATLGEHQLAAPAVIVVGEVARTRLDWFERRPLWGRSVVVTRARHQSAGLVRRLEELGASVREAPTIEVVAPSDAGAALRAAAGRLADADWVVFTSANGVARCFEALRDARDLAGARVAVIGPGTGAELAAHGVVADLVPRRYVAEGLLEELPAAPPEGGRVVVVQAEVARDVLGPGLGASGWEVEVVPAYRTVPTEPSDQQRRDVRAADAICFTSASTAANFADAHGADAAPAVVAAIGPITAAAAEAAGMTVDVVAEPHTLDALVEGLARHLGRQTAQP